MKSPRLSIIVPVYKVEEYLEQCVDSVLGQTFTDFELFLVDDGSPDSCLSLCEDYARKDSRIRVIHQDNLGLAGARNTGLALARGDYVAFLDSDDYLEPDAYAKLYAAAQKHDADIVFCQAKYFDDTRQAMVEADDSSSLPLFEGEHFSGSFTWRDIGADKIFSYDSFVVAWNKICKRSFLAELGADFPLGLIYEDNPFYFQTIFAAKRLCAVRERLIIYRINRKGSIIHELDDGKDARAMHILGIIADTERRLSAVAPEEVRPFFFRYALQEIQYKYSLIPLSLQQKYLILAKGLLPFASYLRLRLRLWVKEMKKHFSLFPLRYSCGKRLRTVCLFGSFQLLSVEKRSDAPGKYRAIVIMGDMNASFAFPQEDKVKNACLLCREFTLSDLFRHLTSFIAIPGTGQVAFFIHSGEQENSASALRQEMAFVRGLFALSTSVLFIDNTASGLARDKLKSLFYRLNCIFLEKNINFIACAEPAIAPAGRIRLPKGLDCLPQERIGDVSIRRKLQTFERSLVIKVLGIPVIKAYRK